MDIAIIRAYNLRGLTRGRGVDFETNSFVGIFSMPQQCWFRKRVHTVIYQLRLGHQTLMIKVLKKNHIRWILIEPAYSSGFLMSPEDSSGAKLMLLQTCIQTAWIRSILAGFNLSLFWNRILITWKYHKTLYKLWLWLFTGFK